MYFIDKVDYNIYNFVFLIFYYIELSNNNEVHPL